MPWRSKSIRTRPLTTCHMPQSPLESSKKGTLLISLKAGIDNKERFQEIQEATEQGGFERWIT